MTWHEVTFYSPGTFVAEDSTRRVRSWSVKVARKMAEALTERHGAIPYGFRFCTMERKKLNGPAKVIEQSPMYYLPHCKVQTIEDVRKSDPGSILLRNMECNKWDRIVTTTKGWKWSQPLRPDDVVLS